MQKISIKSFLILALIFSGFYSLAAQDLQTARRNLMPVPASLQFQTGRLAITDSFAIAVKGHSDVIFSVAFSPDGQRIVTGSGDHTIKVWEAASKEQVAKWHEEERTAAAVKQAPANPR